MENFDLKVKYDTQLDNLFFSKDFKNSMLAQFGIAPAGLTIDTRYDKDAGFGDIYFAICCKRYGYEYSERDHVIGDYSLTHYKLTDDMEQHCVNYLAEKKPELYEEMIKYGIY